MKRWISLTPVIFALVFFSASPAQPQTAKMDAKPMARARVSLYRIAPGKHLEFLKWLADADAMDKEAGVPTSQIYAHTDGDAWDYMGIAPDLSPEQQKKVDEVAKKHGRKTGFASGLEFRALVSWHTDTFVNGPVTAAELVAAAGK
ncbi:MAG: hypothetical protein ABI914_07855 [Acidobacteriota bacterium]